MTIFEDSLTVLRQMQACKWTPQPNIGAYKAMLDPHTISVTYPTGWKKPRVDAVVQVINYAIGRAGFKDGKDTNPDALFVTAKKDCFELYSNYPLKVELTGLKKIIETLAGKAIQNWERKVLEDGEKVYVRPLGGYGTYPDVKTRDELFPALGTIVGNLADDAHLDRGNVGVVYINDEGEIMRAPGPFILPKAKFGGEKNGAKKSTKPKWGNGGLDAETPEEAWEWRTEANNGRLSKLLVVRPGTAAHVVLAEGLGYKGPIQ